MAVSFPSSNGWLVLSTLRNDNSIKIRLNNFTPDILLFYRFEFITDNDIPTHSQDIGPNDPGTVSYIVKLKVKMCDKNSAIMLLIIFFLKKADMAIGVIAVLEERNQVADVICLFNEDLKYGFKSLAKNYRLNYRFLIRCLKMD